MNSQVDFFISAAFIILFLIVSYLAEREKLDARTATVTIAVLAIVSLILIRGL